jgi:DNA-directed RNA polymerase III subunit RPC2
MDEHRPLKRRLSSNTDISSLSKPISSLEDKYSLIPSFLQARGLVNQHIASFNYFIDCELMNILKANSKVTSDANPAWHLT